MFDWFVLSDVWMCYLPEHSVAMCLRRSHHPLLQGTTESVLTSCITVWYGNCTAADHKTLQRTVNTTAKIIGALLPSILDISLARCSSKANSITKDLPTVSSSSYHQEDRTGASEPAPPDCSTAFSPGCESPELNSPHPSLKPHTNPLPPETWTILPPKLSLFAHVQYLWGICTVVQFVCFSLCIGNHFYI